MSLIFCFHLFSSLLKRISNILAWSWIIWFGVVVHFLSSLSFLVPLPFLVSLLIQNTQLFFPFLSLPDMYLSNDDVISPTHLLCQSHPPLPFFGLRRNQRLTLDTPTPSSYPFFPTRVLTLNNLSFRGSFFRENPAGSKLFIRLFVCCLYCMCQLSVYEAKSAFVFFVLFCSGDNYCM